MKELKEHSKRRDAVQQQLKDCLQLLKEIFESNLLGVYLYGSSLVGGLQRYSDIDLFVVISRKTSAEEKSRLITALLKISGIYMKEVKPPIEMTLVEKSAVNPWSFPPSFDFQYGEWLRDSFEKGVIEPWQSYEMEDLALIITQIFLKSETLYGDEPKELLACVPYSDFMKAMLHDLERLRSELEEDTRNVLLTYARTWSTIETKSIRSKQAAADWVINRLPVKYRPVMKRAKSISIGEEEEYWDDIAPLIAPCADYIVKEIETKAPSIPFDGPIESITLAEGSS